MATLEGESAKVLAELNARMEALKSEFKSQGEVLLKGSLEELFNNHPRVEKIQFGGFTPFFNDGEPCVFGIVEYLTKINDFGVEDGYGDDSDKNPIFETIWGDTGKKQKETKYDFNTHKHIETGNMVPKYGQIPNPYYDPELGAAGKDLIKIIRSVNDDTYEDIFGSHFIVTATRGKLEVEEYLDHD